MSTTFVWYIPRSQHVRPIHCNKLEVVRIVYVEEAGTLLYFLKKSHRRRQTLITCSWRGIGDSHVEALKECMCVTARGHCLAAENYRSVGFISRTAWNTKHQYGKYRINLIDSVFSDERAL
jgi:hypothetical protein